MHLTIFSTSEPLQKVVRISLNGHFMATAGLDGHVRIWKFPQLKKLVDIAAHSKEVDDIDFNQNETEVNLDFCFRHFSIIIMNFI